MSQKRVAVVLASLVATLTLSAGALLLMEGGPVDNATAAVAYQSQNSLAAQLVPAVPLQSGQWQYIIVYESRDWAGSAASLADGRLNGDDGTASTTVRPKANFHFVIDSARSRHDAAMDGELEVGTAWLNQELGAPYAGWPDIRYYNVSLYKNTVGICLVGDLSRAPLSDSQHHTLIQLVRELQYRFKIPPERVKFQWELQPSGIPVSSGQKVYADLVRASLE